MPEKMLLEARLMKSMLPPLYVSSIDDILKKLEEDPRAVGDNSIKMLGTILRGQLGMYARTEVVNLFFAGILVARALDHSPEFREATSAFLNDDDATGRNRIIGFQEARAKIKGFV